MNNNMRVVVYTGAAHEMPVGEFVVWLGNIVSEIPEEYLTVATIEFESDHDEYHATITISYIRPKNHEEIKTDVERDVADKAYHRSRNIRLLAELKKKYPDD